MPSFVKKAWAKSFGIEKVDLLASSRAAKSCIRESLSDQGIAGHQKDSGFFYEDVISRFQLHFKKDYQVILWVATIVKERGHLMMDRS
jgi:hypothetical protein